MALFSQDASHPFFRPLWRRLVTLAVCAGWLAFEAFLGDPTFAVIAAGLLAYGIWVLLIAYDTAAADRRRAAEKGTTDATDAKRTDKDGNEA